MNRESLLDTSIIMMFKLMYRERLNLSQCRFFLDESYAVLKHPI